MPTSLSYVTLEATYVQKPNAPSTIQQRIMLRILTIFFMFFGERVAHIPAKAWQKLPVRVLLTNRKIDEVLKMSVESIEMPDK